MDLSDGLEEAVESAAVTLPVITQIDAEQAQKHPRCRFDVIEAAVLQRPPKQLTGRSALLCALARATGDIYVILSRLFVPPKRVIAPRRADLLNGPIIQGRWRGRALALAHPLPELPAAAINVDGSLEHQVDRLAAIFGPEGVLLLPPTQVPLQTGRHLGA